METAEMRRSTLQRKDRDELTHIAETLGEKPPSRARKGEIIDLILDLVSNGASEGSESTDAEAASADTAADAAAAEAVPEAERHDSPSRRRNRRRGRERENREDPGEDFEGEPVAVRGHLDLRNEGYGFLRVNGYLASRDDCYVPVKLVRRLGLRKGDVVAGEARPAGRSEKNPALLSVTEVNGADPDAAADRPRFDDMTAVFPAERIALERADHAEPADAVAARAIDLVAPIGKGQRGLITAGLLAGRILVLKQIVRALETNETPLQVMLLLVDSRPEDVTEMRRWCRSAEVVASPFDRTAEEHVTLAEMTIERAKRTAELGGDVCVVVDSLTRLSRAYAAEAAQGAKAKTSGNELAAIGHARRLFAAGRNLEEAGSVTVLATLFDEPGSPTDEMIADEFRPAASMELRLDAGLAARRILPAIDLAGSHTLNEELLLDSRPLDQLHSLRRILGAASEAGPPSAGLELLLDHLGSSASNRDLFAKVVSGRAGA